MRSAFGNSTCGCGPAYGAATDSGASSTSWTTYAQGAIQLYKNSQDQPAYLRMKQAEQDLQRLVLGGGSLKQIGDARAKFEAAKRDVQLEAEGLDSSREWSTLGKLVIVSSIGLAAVGAILLLSKAVK